MLVIIFLLALSSILFFPDLDVGSFAPRSLRPTSDGAGGGELLLQDSNENTWRGKEPALVDPDDPESEEGGDLPAGYQLALEADDPLIKRIEELRTKLADNYSVEYVQSEK